MHSDYQDLRPRFLDDNGQLASGGHVSLHDFRARILSWVSNRWLLKDILNLVLADAALPKPLERMVCVYDSLGHSTRKRILLYSIALCQEFCKHTSRRPFRSVSCKCEAHRLEIADCHCVLLLARGRVVLFLGTPHPPPPPERFSQMRGCLTPRAQIRFLPQIRNSPTRFRPRFGARDRPARAPRHPNPTQAAFGPWRIAGWLS